MPSPSGPFQLLASHSALLHFWGREISGDASMKTFPAKLSGTVPGIPVSPLMDWYVMRSLCVPVGTKYCPVMSTGSTSDRMPLATAKTSERSTAEW